MKREEALLEFKKGMDKAGIEFMLGHGTCLGVYRDGEILENDHDIDISIFGSDVKSVAKAVGWKYGIRWSKPNEHTFLVDGIKFDVTFWQKVGNEYHNNQRFHKPARLPEKFAELKPIEFLGETFLIPKHTEEYLEYYYEKSWETKIDNKTALVRR